jgi:hypothetical protein
MYGRDTRTCNPFTSDRDYSYLEEKDKQEVLSLYIDDKEKASAKGRVILALNIQAVSMELQQRIPVNGPGYPVRL